MNRPPVSDRPTEIALLAAALDSKQARDAARKILRRGDFYQPAFETVWDAMGTLDRDGRPVDIHTLRAALEGERWADDLLIEIVTAHDAIPVNAEHYAQIVRTWAQRRNIADTARHVALEAMSPRGGEPGFATEVASRFAGLRDDGSCGDEVTARFGFEIRDDPAPEYDWLIPGLIERHDRLMLTGEEGLGKSHLLRQFATHAAGGMHPFDMERRFEPIRALILDAENSRRQVDRKLLPQMDWVARYGEDPGKNLMVDCINRLDITSDRALAKIHQTLDAHLPDLVVIGPLYRLTFGSLDKEEDAARILATIDGIRARGCAVLVEAHAGHGEQNGHSRVRSLRPRGSSSLMGWPEFGLGMRYGEQEHHAELLPWRGSREEREWPKMLRRADGFRWLPVVGW